MDDLQFGTRDKRGNWTPTELAEVAPIWRMPLQLGAALRWLPGYFLPFNLLWAALAMAYWIWLIPDQTTLQNLGWGWALKLFAANNLIVLAIYGALELRLYSRRAQGARFKYNSKFPADHPSDVFLFKSQNIDNALRSFGIGLPIWTLFQVLMLWAWANNVGAWLTWNESPVYLALLALMVPFIHETHFYVIHRLIHTPLLYKYIHSVHHNSNNPSPWSSLSMHPAEHLLYFSAIFYHLLIASHPVIALYQIGFAGFGAFVGHIGFHRIEVDEDRAYDSHAYIHYLHHKYFEVNYGDGLVPFDKIFGTFHDGSEGADEQMKARFRAKKARVNARARGDKK